MNQRLSTLLSLYSLHIYAVTAILLAALSQQFAALLLLILLYLFDLFFVRQRTKGSVSDPLALKDRPSLSDPTTDAGASFYAATAVDLNPFAVSLDDDVTPSVLDSPLPEHSAEESLPIHNLEVLQAYVSDLPEDAKLTVQDDSANPWLRALQSMQTSEGVLDSSIISSRSVTPPHGTPLPSIIIDDEVSNAEED